MEVPVFLFFAGLIGVAPAAVPERIDAQPVSVWVATAGLVDDRPPLLVVDTSVLEMDAGLAGAAGWAPFAYDWRHGLATDLAEDHAETKIGRANVCTPVTNAHIVCPLP